RHLFPGLFVLFLTVAAIVRYGDEDRSRPLLRALDIAIVALAIVSYWGAITPSKYILRLWGIRILSVSSSDLPFTLLLLLVFIRMLIQRPVVRLPRTLWIGVLCLAIGELGAFCVFTFAQSMCDHSRPA